MSLTVCEDCGAPSRGTRCKMHAAEHRQRARRLGSTGARGSNRRWRKLRARVLAAALHRCLYCGAEATTVDHMWPLSRGGTNDEVNLCAACEPCNREKGTMTSTEYLEYRMNKRNVDTQGTPSPSCVTTVGTQEEGGREISETHSLDTGPGPAAKKTSVAPRAASHPTSVTSAVTHDPDG